MRHSTISLTTLLMLGSTAAAQSGGPTMALAQGFSVDPASAGALPGFTEASIVLNETDFDAAPPTNQWVPGLPDWTSLPFPPGIDVDALSIGMDWVLSDWYGYIAIPTGQWGVLTYSVRRGTNGVPGTVVNTEATAPDGSAADIFAYILPGSALPLPMVGIPFRAQDSTEITVPSGFVGPNIDAHDLFIGLIYRDNPQIAMNLPPPTVYFSVTDATKGLIPIGLGISDWLSPANAGLASGATVFQTTWQPGPYSWSTPMVYLRPIDMGLELIEDLDGLALDPANYRLLLSTDPAFPPAFPTPPRNPVLYSNLLSFSHTVYKLPNGSPVSTAIGLMPGLPDDADGLCMLDPGTLAVPSQGRIDRLVGSPRFPVVTNVPTTLQACVVRHGIWGTSQQYFRTFMTGWPIPGPNSQGFAIAAVTVGPPQFGPWVTLPSFFMRPGGQYQMFQGHPEVIDWQIPFQFSGTNIPVTFVWGALSIAGFGAMSHPLTITL